MAEQIVIRPRFVILYVFIIAAALLAALALGFADVAGLILLPLTLLGLAALYAGIAVLAGLAIIAVFLKYLATTYIITDHEVIAIEGLVTKTRRSVPFTKIDNITVRQGLRDYVLHTASLKIDTPGGPGPEICMKFIDSSQVHWLEAHLKEQISHARAPPPEDSFRRDERESDRDAERDFYERPADERPAGTRPTRGFPREDDGSQRSPPPPPPAQRRRPPPRQGR